MATTFAAFSADPAALQETIEKSPPTIDTVDQLLPRPAPVPGRLRRPVAPPAAGGQRAAALAAGDQQRVPRGHPDAAAHRGPQRAACARRFDELDDLFENPNTLLALRDLRTTLAVTRPALEFIAPYQTVCNYWNYFVHPLGEHQSTVSPLGGTVQQQGVKPAEQRCRPTPRRRSEARGRGTCRPGVDPVGAEAALGMPLGRVYSDALPAGDRRPGQRRLPERPERLRPRPARPRPRATGRARSRRRRRPAATRPWRINNFPILSGGTYKSRELGLNNLQDVDKLR